MTARAPRIGVFGGAFDPPHEAHVALVKAALDQLDLIELRIFPTGSAWHKTRTLSAPQHRLAMAHLAFDGIAHASVDPREMMRSGPTYTLDTLRELQAERPGAQLVLVIGADQAGALTSWHGWQEIVQRAAIAVAWRPRPGVSVTATRILPAAPPGAHFETLELDPSTLSATDIRSRAQRGEPLDRLVPAAVARYIDQHHLYRST